MTEDRAPDPASPTFERRRLVALAEVTFAVAAWGASFVATKVALQEAQPLTVVWLRFAMGTLILGVAVVARRQLRRVPPRDLAYFALLGFLGITLHQWLQSTGLVTAGATTSAWIITTIPVFIAVLGWLVLREGMRVVQLVGIACAALGVLIVVSKGDPAALLSGTFGTYGDFLVLLSAVNWAVFTVLSRRGLRDYPATGMMVYVMTLGWLFTTPLFLAGPGLGDMARLSASGWQGVIFLGVFCSGLAYIFWYDALQVIPASQVGAFLYVEPLVTVAVAAAVLSEPVVPAALLGGAIIVLGVWLVNRRPAIE